MLNSLRISPFFILALLSVASFAPSLHAMETMLSQGGPLTHANESNDLPFAENEAEEKESASEKEAGSEEVSLVSTFSYHPPRGTAFTDAAAQTIPSSFKPSLSKPPDPIA